jgi:hypothetical protein
MPRVDCACGAAGAREWPAQAQWRCSGGGAPRRAALRSGGARAHGRGRPAPPAALSAAALSAAAAAAAAQPAPLPALLQSAGFFILACAGALFLLAAVPAMIALARMALRAESVLRVSPASHARRACSAGEEGAEVARRRGALAARGARRARRRAPSRTIVQRRRRPPLTPPRTCRPNRS